MSKNTTATESAATEPIEVPATVALDLDYTPPAKANEYAATVDALKDAGRGVARITVPTADIPKHLARFAKAANAITMGARKRDLIDNGDGTSTLVVGLGVMRGTAKSATVDAGVAATEVE